MLVTRCRKEGNKLGISSEIDKKPFEQEKVKMGEKKVGNKRCRPATVHKTGLEKNLLLGVGNGKKASVDILVTPEHSRRQRYLVELGKKSER